MHLDKLLGDELILPLESPSSNRRDLKETKTQISLCANFVEFEQVGNTTKGSALRPSINLPYFHRVILSIYVIQLEKVDT